MCALLAMAVHDTVKNQRTEYTRKTLKSLESTVDFFKHRLFIVDNDSCEETKDILGEFQYKYFNKVFHITNTPNIGTAEAINLAWKYREKGENCVKLDNDVLIHRKGWVDELEEVIIREPKIGQIGLKRKDLEESPNQTNPHFKSSLKMLSHEKGERWIIIEEANHIMGTCVMHSSALLDKVGYLKQCGLYGFDDSLMSFRSKKAGFINCFLPHIEIDHIDTGENPYTKEKQALANEAWPKYQQLIQDYQSGKENIYYNPFK